MAAVGIFESLILLVVAGVFIAVVALIALLVAKGRGGIALLIGGLALFGMLFGAAILWMFVGYSHVRTETAQLTPVGGMQVLAPKWTTTGIPQYPPLTVVKDSWAISFASMFLIGIVLLVFFAIANRRGFAHSVATGHHRAWPTWFAIPVLGFLVLGGIRYERGMVSGRRQTEATEQASQMAVAQLQQLPEQLAAMKADVHNQIDRMDINQLMEKFDAPRIVLQAPMAPSPASAAIAIAATAQSPAKAAPHAAAQEAPRQTASSSRPNRAKPKQKSTTTTAKNAAKSNPFDEDLKISAATPGAIVASTGTAAETAQPFAKAELDNADGISPLGAIASATRPSWIDDQPVRTGSPQREVITTDEYATPEECYQAGDILLMLKTYERIQQLTGRPYNDTPRPSLTFREGETRTEGGLVLQRQSYWLDQRLRDMAGMGITGHFLRGTIVAKDARDGRGREYLETVARSFGPMKKLSMQVEFSRNTDGQLQTLAEAYYRKSRFAYVGAGAASVLGMLCMVWGLVKVDTATKGYYTKRLFIGVPLGILLASGLFMLFAKTAVVVSGQ